jgi:diketogulonate reductase-like aldo/keto reductase
MAYAQRDAWGLDYIGLYLIHFPVALKYIEPEKLRYPVSITIYFFVVMLTLRRPGGEMQNTK